LDLKVMLIERSGKVVAEVARRTKRAFDARVIPSSPTAIRKSVGSE
jgi:hypothetical protein